MLLPNVSNTFRITGSVRGRGLSRRHSIQAQDTVSSRPPPRFSKAHRRASSLTGLTVKEEIEEQQTDRGISDEAASYLERIPGSPSKPVDTPPKKIQKSSAARTLQPTSLFQDGSGGGGGGGSASSKASSLPREVRELLSGLPSSSSTNESASSPSKMPEWLAEELRVRREQRAFELLEKAAAGETGNLSPIYWRYCRSSMKRIATCPSAKYYATRVLSRYSLKSIVKQIVVNFARFFPEMICNAFSRTTEAGEDETVAYVPYTSYLREVIG